MHWLGEERDLVLSIIRSLLFVIPRAFDRAHISFFRHPEGCRGMEKRIYISLALVSLKHTASGGGVFARLLRDKDQVLLLLVSAVRGASEGEEELLMRVSE